MKGHLQLPPPAPVASKTAPLDPHFQSSSSLPPPQSRTGDLPLFSHDGGAAEPRSLTRGKRGRRWRKQAEDGRDPSKGRPGMETPGIEREGTRDPRSLRPAARPANTQKSLLLALQLRLSQARGEANSPQRTARASGPLSPKLPRPHPPSGARSHLHLDSEARMEKLWRGIGTHPRATPAQQERSAVPDGRQRQGCRDADLAAVQRRWPFPGGTESPLSPGSNSAPKCLCRKTC